MSIASGKSIYLPTYYWFGGADNRTRANHRYKLRAIGATSTGLHPTYLYNLCGHVLSSIQIAKYLGITLTDELF